MKKIYIKPELRAARFGGEHLAAAETSSDINVAAYSMQDFDSLLQTKVNAVNGGVSISEIMKYQKSN